MKYMSLESLGIPMESLEYRYVTYRALLRICVRLMSVIYGYRGITCNNICNRALLWIYRALLRDIQGSFSSGVTRASYILPDTGYVPSCTTLYDIHVTR